MIEPAFSQKARAAALLVATIAVWILLAMVFFERFPPPVDRLVPLLMPWKGLATLPPRAGIGERLQLMQHLLDLSTRVSQYSFAVMVASFAAFSIFLSVLYQQKQRRSRENLLLLLKNQEIARRTEFIRYISATIGHEFKNNLGRIKRRLDLLPGLDSDAKMRLDDNLDKLFADIDIFKRISDEREAGLVAFENVDLLRLLNAVGRQFTGLVDIAVAGDEPVPMLYASPMLLKTVFENVIDNALKYKKPDQPRARMRITCGIDRDGSRRYVALSFRDEGVGMDERQADQCFYRGKGSGEGWGQGLYFAKYAVGLHAGKIRVGKEHTAPGAGTEIIIHLPFVEEDAGV